MSIEQIAFEFLRSLSGNCPEEIVDYLVFLFECDEKPDQSLLEDSLVGSVPEFAFLSEKDRKAALQDLISQVESFKFSKLSLSSTVSSPKAKKAGKKQQASVRQASQEDAKGESTHRQTSSCTQCQEGTNVSDAKSDEVAQLRELCPPTVSDPFLRHVLEKVAKGDVQVAALWLIDAEDVEGRQSAWEASERKAREQSVLAKQQERTERQRFFARYGLQVVSDQQGKKGGKPVSERVKGPSKQDAPPKVRYREGRPVTTKGEKYVVERIGEEWDGGSKGKVYTKGKRGKGVV